MRKETVDIVEELVNFLVSKVVISSIVNNNDNTYTLFTNNTSYLAPNMVINIGVNSYKVLNNDLYPFNFNNSFTIEGSVDPSGTLEIFLGPLKYFHGTVIDTKGVLNKINISTDKLPMIYLLEVLKDKFNNDVNLRVDRVSDLRLFFLSETDENNWTTDQHYEYSIKPMRNVVYNFIESLNKNAGIGEFDDYVAINHVKFGVVIPDKGHTRRVFDDNLSGVELVISLPILKGKICQKL